MTSPVVLGIETSCDETSAGLLRGERELLAHVILSQDVHQVYGGVVPELAARAHLSVLGDVVDRTLEDGGMALEDVDAVGVTVGPGLIGALLVGVAWAKAAAWALNRPLVPVHHMEAHLFAPSLEEPDAEPPFVALLVSGGHTLLLHAEAWGRYRLLGSTRDDAVGEAYDKVAKILGLPYPGGPHVERLALEGDPARHRFTRPMLRRDQRPGDPDYFDFSFSGLKTAVAGRVSELVSEGTLEDERSHIAAAFQDAVVDTLVSKTLRAVELVGCPRVLLGGGVSANRGLRESMAERLGTQGRVFFSSPRLAQDNGAMVARAAAFHLAHDRVADLTVSADAALPFPGLISEAEPAA